MRSFDRLVRPVRRRVQSARRLELTAGCEVQPPAPATMSFDEAAQRADTTRFIVAASSSPAAADRQLTADWLRRMAAHLAAAADATGQRGTQWGRAPSILRLQPDPDVDLLPPEPDRRSSGGGEDAYRLAAAGYWEALRLAFVVVDVLLLSYHVTRTCVSAHALWTVGCRRRVPVRSADMASVRCETRADQRAPAVVMATGGELAGTGCDGGPAPRHASNFSSSNHHDAARPPSFTWSNHSAVDLRPQPMTCSSTAAARNSLPLKAKRRSISLNLSRCYR